MCKYCVKQVERDVAKNDLAFFEYINHSVVMSIFGLRKVFAVFLVRFYSNPQPH